MVAERVLFEQIKHVLEKTDFNSLGEKYEGKVRDSYTKGAIRFLVTTDRLSCFDRVVTSVPFKGEILQRIAANWFKLSEDIIKNHIIDLPDSNVMVVKNCEILPIEVVVRSYLTGSAWRDYEAGRAISGIKLPSGLRRNAKLPEVILTPSTKAEQGKHDTPISEKEILESGIIEKSIWQEVRAAAMELFALGEEVCNRQGLILVDTKYEFGIYQGGVILADEIHTLDSSRFWERETYEGRFEKGEDPQMLDKEPTRQWLISQNFMGDGPIPAFSDERRVDIAKHYIHALERITGEEFEAKVEPPTKRIQGKIPQLLKLY